jgi:C4-dicarboxylate transporter DctQ subunit
VFKKVDQAIYSGEKVLLGLGLLGSMILLFINVSYRDLLQGSFDWVEELIRYVMVWISFIGASVCVRTNAHVIMDVIFERLELKNKKIIFLIICITCCISSVFLAVIGINHTRFVYGTGQISVALNIEMFWVYLAYPIGFFLMAKDFLQLFIVNLKDSSRVINALQPKV